MASALGNAVYQVASQYQGQATPLNITQQAISDRTNEVASGNIGAAALAYQTQIPTGPSFSSVLPTPTTNNPTPGGQEIATGVQNVVTKPQFWARMAADAALPDIINGENFKYHSIAPR